MRSDDIFHYHNINNKIKNPIIKSKLTHLLFTKFVCIPIPCRESYSRSLHEIHFGPTSVPNINIEIAFPHRTLFNDFAIPINTSVLRRKHHTSSKHHVQLFLHCDCIILFQRLNAQGMRKSIIT